MDESEDNISSEDIKFMISPCLSKVKPKKRSLVERELETSLTARVTSPMTNDDGASTSRYGRTRRIKADGDYIDTEKCIKIMDSPTYEKTPVKLQSPVYKMHASNSPIKLEPKETPIKSSDIDSSLNNQIENIYSENISLSRFSSEEKKNNTPGNKLPKVYVRKDLIQSREKDEYVMLIKNMFSPPKSARKSNSHLNNILERSSEKYGLNTSTEKLKPHNGFSNNASVVKTLDFDSNKKKKEEKDGKVLSQSDLFHLEAKCEYQVGDLAWARMGTYPFWPCIVTREPSSGMFVKKKLFGRIEHDIVHVTFFGDNGRRGWIVDTMLRRFLGQLEFEATRESFTPSDKKKDPRLYAAFFVSEKTMPRWTISVEEAETLLREPKRLRIDILYDMLAKTRSGKSTPKQQKSEKISRTASNVESDVSLSESLYDTLFSEDDGKSEDTERSRSKTRLSLDVSDVVTACLDNMAAKSGITKIQRQSHMDRWLQKAKSKTPEKSQANLPPPKEKETKSTSAKKKKVAPVMVPIKKPYSLRKSSHELQVLKSNDNEHDYSTKISNDTPQTCNDVQANASYDMSFEVKVELLQDKPGDEDTTGDKTTHIDTTESEVVKAADSGDTRYENTNQNKQIDITGEEVSEIQENICSVEENEELLLGQTENSVEAETVNSSIADSESQSEIVKINKHSDKRNANDIQQLQIKNQVNEASVKINKEPEKPMEVEESVVNIKLESEHNTEDKTIEAHTTADESRETEKKVVIAQTPEMQPKKSSRIINKVKQAVTTTPEFVKYLELRQDALMDEHPELSQKEIEEYLYKTWQYEESAKYDFKNPEEITPKSTFVSKNKKRDSRNRSKKRAEGALPRNILFNNSSTKTNVQAQLNSPSTSKDTNEIKSSFSKDNNSTIKKIEGISKLTETPPESAPKPVDSTKISENKTDKAKNNSTPIVPSTSGRKSLRLLRSPASNYPQEMSSASKTAENTQSGANLETEIHTKITVKLEEEVDAPKPSSNDVDKVNIDTTPTASTSGRRSLRNRLSRSPATPKDSIKAISAEISIVKTMENKNVEPMVAEQQPESTPELDKQSIILPPTQLDEKVDKEKEKSVQYVPFTSSRKSLRTRTSKSPASTKCIIENRNNISNESNSVKLPECNKIVTENCFTENLPDMKSEALTTETCEESNIDKLKREIKPVKNKNSFKRSIRIRLSRHIDETTNNINKETTLSTENIHTKLENAENTPKIDKQKDDSPKLSEVKEQTKSPLVADVSVRRSRRSKLMTSRAITVDKNESTTVNKDCKFQTQESVKTEAAIKEKEPDITQKLHEQSIVKSNESDNNIDENKLSAVSTENHVINESSQVANELESPTECEENNDKKDVLGITSKVKDKDLTIESQIEVELEIPREIEEEMIETITRLSKDLKEQEGSTVEMDVSMNTQEHTNLDQPTEPKINLEKAIDVTQISVQKDSTLGMDNNVNIKEHTDKIQVKEPEINLEIANNVHQIALKKDSTFEIDDNINTEEHTNKSQVTKPKINLEITIDVTQKAAENCLKTEDQIDSILNRDDRGEKTSIDIAVLTETSCAEPTTETTRAETSEVVQTEKSRTDSKMPTVIPTANKQATEINNDEQIIDKEQPIENIEEHKTDEQVDISELIQKQAVNGPVKDDVPHEDKEYGHLDFVFSVLDEKIKGSNDINKTVIENNVSNTDSISIEKAQSIDITHSEGNIDPKCNKIKSNIDTFESHVDKLVEPSIEKVQINHKEMNVEEFVKCKYEKLYNSCTALKVKVERLPRLSSKVIKMKDLDKEIALSTTRPKRFKKKSLKLNRKVPVFNEEESEKRIANGRDETCIVNTKIQIKNIDEQSQVNGDISNHSIEINHYKKERLSEKNHHNNVKNETNNDCRDITDAKILHTVEDGDKSKKLSENNNDKDSIVYTTKISEQNGDATVAKMSVESEPIDISKDKKNIEHTRVIKEDNIKIDSKEVFNRVSQSDHTDQIYPHLNAQPQTLLPKENVEHSRNKSDFYTVGTKSETVKVPQVKPCPKANENILPKVDFKPVPVAEPGKPDQIRPSALSNGYDYLYDDEDDEEEFESPAFSPIFKEPIEPEQKDNKDELDKKDSQDDSKKPGEVLEKTDTNSSDKSMSKDDSLRPSVHKEDVTIPTDNKTQEVITNSEVTTLMEEKNAKNVKDELMTSVSRLPDPVKINGYHLDEYGLDCSDNDFNVETSSINSEDSEPLSVTKNKLVSKNRKNAKKALEDVEFVKYLELKQDALMDEHPELNQDEIVEYLYKTWQYEESLKSDIRKNDDIEQAVLVKGLNDDLRQKSMKNRYRENKKRRTKVDDDALSISSNASKKGDEDTISIDSDVSDTSSRRRLRSRFSNSPALSVDENEYCISKESSPERKPDLEDKSLDSDDFIKLTKRKVRNQILDDSLDDEDFPKVKEESSKDDSTVTAKREESRPKKTNNSNKSPKSHKETKIKKYFEVINSNKETKITIKISDTNEQESKDNEIKEEPDPDTVSMASINSEDSEVSLSKRKQRKDKQSTKPMEEPEFLNYVEMRQDVLIDENPQLTQEEIIAYLYKTWLYEESVKSDLKKSDEIEQANLVKGLNSDVVQPKKVRKKIKTEKALAIEEAAKEKQDKPKRKTYQPYYNEDTISDIEDEIELFEIFRTKKKKSLDIKSELISEAAKETGVTSTVTNEETELDVIDEVELYFEQLTKPKPNVFKGLVREKVCEFCEKTGNLVKCKGCCGMFHVGCQLKPKEEEVVSTRGRKKKKKLGRKPKNLDDSGSHSDEKSQDVSEEHNASIEEEPEPIIVDEAVLEAALTAKMKEIYPTIDLTYDAYPSDIALDWNTARPGQCEIVDVKMEPKIDDTNFKCGNCQTYSTPVCFVCKEAVSKTGVHHRQKCHTNHCNKYYHLECLDHWPQTQFNTGELCKKKNNEHDTVVCPRHVCHTCVSDDPRGCRTRFSGDKLARCVRCPATYHSFTKCLPAGTQILTGSLILCPRHYEHRPGKVPCHVNTGWCFICALGGSLICCEYCPTSFHAECLNIKPPEGGYMCEDCETGRLPLYGEMVWVKLGHYRWWPGIILHPSEIPENILAVKHSHGEFVVRFFGQYDHYWVNRGRVFPFQEGDSGRISTQKSKIDSDFITAMEHAHRAFEILKNAGPNDDESNDIASSLLPPHYVKLKVNKPCGSLIGRRPDIEESSLTQCECDPMVEDPCGPYSHCLNRMLLTECGPICRAGDRCNNRAFEKRLYPKMVPYRTPHRGWGLKTLENIRAGQFVIEYVGELIDEEEFRRRMDWMHEIRDENFYFLTLDKERMIDAGPKGNLARFMNHCCEPNCETQKWTVLGDVRVGLFAINDIPANSELTFNYNLECTGIEKKRCMCGAKRCSGYIGAKPKQIEETQPKKKRVYKKRAKPIDESPSTSKNKPKRPVGRPPKPRELTEIEKDLLIIKSATIDISSDSETSSRLGSIDNPNPKALKRKRVSFSTEESLCSSPSSKISKDNSPSTKKLKIDDQSPSTKKDNIHDNSTNTKKVELDEFTSPNTPSTKQRVDEFVSPSAQDKIEECMTPSTRKVKLDDSKNEPSAKRLKLEEKCEVGD